MESISRYWSERLTRYRLLGSRCRKCGRIYYPPRLRCLCGSTELETYQLPRRGRLIHYTVIHDAPREFKQFEPYYVGLVELEDGTRLVTQLTDVDPTKIREGIAVEAVFRKVREDGKRGLIFYGMKFRPAIKQG